MPNEDREDRLPSELWRLVLERLEVNIIFRFNLVCKIWQDLVRDESFWRMKFGQTFPMASIKASEYRRTFLEIWRGEASFPVEILNPGCRGGTFGSAVRRCVSFNRTISSCAYPLCSLSTSDR
jgi:hypothetical protein